MVRIREVIVAQWLDATISGIVCGAFLIILGGSAHELPQPNLYRGMLGGLLFASSLAVTWHGVLRGSTSGDETGVRSFMYATGLLSTLALAAAMH